MTASRGRRRNQNLAASRNEGFTSRQQSGQFIKTTRFRADDQRLRFINCTATTDRDHRVTLAGLLPKSLVSTTQLGNAGIGLHIFDRIPQTLAQQVLNAINQPQPKRVSTGLWNRAIMAGILLPRELLGVGIWSIRDVCLSTP